MKKIVIMLCTLVLGAVFIQPCSVLMAADSEEETQRGEHESSKHRNHNEHKDKKDSRRN
ncbi:MAG: hypothetical protein LBC04_00330 [Holosporaceae bacterium]|jgi:hypothetical protein|nr:hypothetical protein [Holosporaceae bacterium]